MIIDTVMSCNRCARPALNQKPSSSLQSQAMPGPGHWPARLDPHKKKSLRLPASGRTAAAYESPQPMRARCGHSDRHTTSRAKKNSGVARNTGTTTPSVAGDAPHKITRIPSNYPGTKSVCRSPCAWDLDVPEITHNPTLAGQPPGSPAAAARGAMPPTPHEVRPARYA